MNFNETYISSISKFITETLSINDLSGVDINKFIAKMDVDEKSASSGGELVEVDVAKMDKILKDTDGSYVDNNGKGGSPDKYQNALKFFSKDPEEIKFVEAPVIVVDKDSAYIVEGRHRFAVMRALGAKRLKITMNEESIKNSKELGIV